MKKTMALTMVLLIIATSICGCRGEEPVKEYGQFGIFSTIDIYGNPVTQEDMRGKIVMFTIWDQALEGIEKFIEILQKIKNEYANDNVIVVALLADGMDASTMTVRQDVVDSAKAKMESVNANFTLLVPNEHFVRNCLVYIENTPTTFFVDVDGNYLSDSYISGYGFSTWQALIGEILINKQKDA